MVSQAVLTESFALGLCAYLRQAALSLDRGHGACWPKLRAYYASSVEPRIDTMLFLLKEIVAYSTRGKAATAPMPDLQSLSVSKWYAFRAGLWAGIRSLFTATIAVPVFQVRFALEACAGYARLIEQESAPEPATWVPVRMALCSAGSLIESRIPSPGHNHELDRVAHFNSAEHPPRLPISKLVCRDWLLPNLVPHQYR